jgi:hypothetical protein
MTISEQVQHIPEVIRRVLVRYHHNGNFRVVCGWIDAIGARRIVFGGIRGERFEY